LEGPRTRAGEHAAERRASRFSLDYRQKRGGSGGARRARGLLL
jgi:hypothetical protein